MKKWLMLEKVMWLLVTCIGLGLFPFCYWAATPDELIIISESEEETSTREVTFEVAPAKKEIEIAATEVAAVEVEPVETTAEPLMAEETSDIESIAMMYEDGYLSYGSFCCTAYCICTECCGKLPTDPAYGITATGTRAEQGRTIAVDPNVIPYGTEVLINGHTYIAEDTGSAIYGKRIDICFTSHAEALAFGVKYIDVYAKG
jgi:3D (Asp-Asp-Asp) domain-containing protein